MDKIQHEFDEVQKTLRFLIEHSEALRQLLIEKKVFTMDELQKMEQRMSATADRIDAGARDAKKRKR